MSSIIISKTQPITHHISSNTTVQTPSKKKAPNCKITKTKHIKSCADAKHDRALKIERDSDKKKRAMIISKLRDSKLMLQSLPEFLQPPCITKSLKENEYAVKLIEDLCFLVIEISWAQNKKQIVNCLLSFIRHRNGLSLTNLLVDQLSNLDRLMSIKDQFMKIFEFELQSSDSPFATCREILDNYTVICETPLMKKMHKFMLYALSLNLFSAIGLDFESFHYSKFEAESIKRKHFVGPDFIHTLCDTFLFILERGYQCVKTGNLDPIYHSGSQYEEWFVTSTKLLRDSNFMTNPEPHGLNRHKFLSDIRDNIEKGDAIYKYALSFTPNDKKLVGKTLNDLKMCLSNEITKRSAQKERKAPFAVLISGGSSVGKSNFSSLLFKHYAKLLNLPDGSEYKYTRNHSDDFWSAFDSTQWCIQMDDIAFMNPNVAQGGGDPSIIEMIKVVNNVPFIPAQADLADKGRTPMLAKLVLATTNIPNLNAHAYFACPLALRRRLPFVITIKVKPEYAKNSVMLDPTRIPPLAEGDYPDLWLINVSVVEPKPGAHNQAQLKSLNDYDNIYKFLSWFNIVSKQHELNQIKSTEVVSTIQLAKLCPLCCIPLIHCLCEEHIEQPIQDLNIELDLFCINCSELHKDCVCCNYCSRCQSLKTQCLCCLLPLCTKCSLTDCRCTISQSMHLQSGTLGLFFIMLSNILPGFIMNYFAGNLYARVYGVLYTIGQMFILKQSLVEYINIFISPRWWFRTLMHIESRYFYFASRLISYTPFLFFFVIYRFRRYYYAFMYLFQIYGNYRNVYDDYDSARRRMFMAGEFVSHKLGKVPKKYKLPVAILTTVTSAAIIHMLYKYVNRPSQEEEEPQMELQATEDIRSERPTGTDKVENVWYKNEFVLTPFCTSDLTRSYAALSESKIHEVILRNCVSLRSRVSGALCSRPTKALCLGGNVYMANNHGIPDGGKLIVNMTSMSSKDGITSNVEFGLSQSQIRRYPENDICIFVVLNVPPRKDITRLFSKTNIRGTYDGYYLARSDLGQPQMNTVMRIQYFDGFPIPGLDIKAPVWVGNSQKFTSNGDCGSPLVVHTPSGPIILGIHIVGSLDSTVGAIALSEELISKFIKDIKEPILQSSAPLLSSSDCEHTLGALHPKSCFRYIESGIAEVHGSFLGFRSNMKSRVQPTLIQTAAVNAGYKVKFGPPVMRGWQPWRASLIDMVKPRGIFDHDILEQAFQSSISSVVKNLPADQYKEIMFYDNFTAINGAAGVKFVDKMNRNTSMGFPWNKGKQYYMFSIPPVGELLDPVNFTPEILERAQHIIETYLRGDRYHPVFKEQLKDEPRSFSKIASSSTRLFSSSPADWSLVGRRCILSIIRVIQNNKYVFGDAPGTAAQTIEWHYMYKYLTRFGTDRIIAGDYKLFDKTMSPVIIMNAFRFFLFLAEKSGYNESELKIMRGIAVDTAYPTVDFNGDLVTFSGTNPSGHIATVTINCRANQSYLRYVFYFLRPPNCNFEFDDVVVLMTYGDDYVGGVSSEIPWFNHSSITRVLATVGVVHTLPDKSSDDTVLYLKIEDVQFLKRRWVFCEETQTYLCPLEEDSIAKMLTVCVSSKTITPREQALEVLNTACQEYFFYGKAKFEERRKVLTKIADESDLADYRKFLSLPTWDELLERYIESSKFIPKPSFC